jgi:hypothetical protein
MHAKAVQMCREYVSPSLHLKQQRDGDKVREKKYLVAKLAGIQHISPLNSGGGGG